LLRGVGAFPTTVYLGEKGLEKLMEFKSIENIEQNFYDSFPGTVIHELSHSIVDTKDHYYGESRCVTHSDDKTKWSPDNADSLEYFCEHSWMNRHLWKPTPSVSITGYWEEVTLRMNGSFTFVRDWYMANQEQDSVLFKSSLHNSEVKGKLEGGIWPLYWERWTNWAGLLNEGASANNTFNGWRR